MRRKKRYVLLKSVPENLPRDLEFLFQSEAGYVFKMDPKSSDVLRGTALLISGSIRKVKAFGSKSSKSSEGKGQGGMK
jgi:hypothetical protein